MIAVSEPPRDDRQQLGRAGEAAAERKLVAAGFRILERRYRKRIGEIDLIASRGELVVFVEVKTRRTDRSGTPGESVTATSSRTSSSGSAAGRRTRMCSGRTASVTGMPPSSGSTSASRGERLIAHAINTLTKSH